MSTEIDSDTARLIAQHEALRQSVKQLLDRIRMMEEEQVQIPYRLACDIAIAYQNVKSVLED